MRDTAGRERYHHRLPILVALIDETSRNSFFPHRQARARRAPRVHHVGARLRRVAQRLEQIEYERLYAFFHEVTLRSHSGEEQAVVILANTRIHFDVEQWIPDLCAAHVRNDVKKKLSPASWCGARPE
jgi:hypothetical protein